MNKKTIQIIIIVVMFASSGFVIYNGFFKNSLSLAPVQSLTLPPESQGAGGTALLPYGDSFDFKVLKSQNLNYDFDIVKVQPDVEVGKDLTEIIKPLPSTVKNVSN